MEINVVKKYIEKPDERSSESGMMVVEAVISFTIFIMVSLLIVYLTNIFILHNKIQFAINSAAHEIASYSYLYEALSLREGEQTIKEDGSAYVQPIDDTTKEVLDTLNKMQETGDSIGGLKDSVNNIEFSESSINDILTQFDAVKQNADGTYQSAKAAASGLKELFSDPQHLLVGIIYLGASGGSYLLKSAVGTGAAWALTGKYLTQGSLDADAYLKSHGIAEGYDGLDFGGSTLFCDDDMRLVDLVVEYDVDLTFVKLLIPDAKLHVVQRVTVPAWLDGDGKKVPALAQ